MRPRSFAGLALLAVLAMPVGGQTLEVSVESREIYSGMPFTLLVSARGFDEQPPPTEPDLAIDGCEVTYIGMTPSVSQQIQIVNGRRSEWREVTFVYRWRVTAPSAGRYTVPALTLRQGSKSAASVAATFDAVDLEQTTDMIVRMRLPDRPVWVGETFDGAIEWLLSRDVESYEFVVPLFELDAVRVEGEAVDGTEAIVSGRRPRHRSAHATGSPAGERDRLCAHPFSIPCDGDARAVFRPGSGERRGQTGIGRGSWLFRLSGL